MIWKLDTELFKKVIAEHNTISAMLKVFGLENKGSNYLTLKTRCLQDGISLSHINFGKGSNKGRKFNSKYQKTLTDVLVENSNANRTSLKHRLLKEGVLKNECVECGQPPMWNNKVLTLQLDHINGIFNDNRLENLRILCGHCHSQTENFAGRNKVRTKLVFCQCGKKIAKNSYKCVYCNNTQRVRKYKFDWPKTDELIKMIANSNYITVAKLLGCSDNTLRKRIKNYPI